MVVPIFIQRALAGEDIPIFGDGTQKEVLDMLEMWSIALWNCEKKNTVGEVFNIGNTKEITIEELAHLIIEKCNSSSKLKYIPYEKAYGKGFEDMRRRKPNTKKLKERLLGLSQK